MSDALPVTVVVCTCGRAASLRRLLESLAVQTRAVAGVLVVDASAEPGCERVVADWTPGPAAPGAAYLRVDAEHRGLTRQRNAALGRVQTELVAFFDDDVVLAPDCLARMVEAYDAGRPDVVGVGAFVIDGTWRAPLLWRVHRMLGMVPDLRPGRYYRSGMSTPWSWMPPDAGVVEGDWLPGCAMMWRTAVARRLGFDAGFAGYAQGEDLEFSLRARREGRLVVCRAAEAQHLQAPGGRPDAVRSGYMQVLNHYVIHRRTFTDRSRRDVAWFAWAWGMDTLLMTRHLLVPRRWPWVFGQALGRGRATRDLLRHRAGRHDAPAAGGAP